MDGPSDDLEAAEVWRQTRGYVVATLHRAMRIQPADLGSLGIGEGLIGRYEMARADIGGQQCIVAFARTPGTPDDLASDLNHIRRQLKALVVLVMANTTSSTRSRLIKLAVPFIVPGSQIYIPELALDLREVFRRPVSVHKGGLTPVAQLVFFHVMLTGAADVTPTSLAPVLSYSTMSLGRALDELEAHGLVTVERRGREKILNVVGGGGQSTLERRRDLLRSPARGVHAVRFLAKKPKLLLAGGSALALCTDFKFDGLPTFAIASAAWRTIFEQNQIEDLPDIEGADAVIETWRYDPWILGDGRKVDPLSLYAQYWDSTDPKYSGAAEQIAESL